MHPDPDAIDRYAARQMPGTEAAAIRQHLLGCPACRERLRASPFYPEAGRRETSVIAGLAERPGCPEPSARIAHAVEALSAERRAEIAGHARGCPHCARDLQALEKLREGARPESERKGCLLGWWMRA